MTVSNDTSPTATTELTLALDDGDLHVRRDGPHDAPALLLLHGTGASLRTWDPMVPQLTGSQHVIRVDLPGCGRSGTPKDGGYAVPDQARRVGEALDRLGVARAIVVGHSSGGAFATALAERRPDLVTAIALVNTGPAMAAYTAADLAVDPARWPELTDAELRGLLSQAFGEGFEIPQPFVDEFRHLDLVVFGALSHAIRAYLEERALPERLAGLGKPLLVLFGEDDRRWRASSAADYHAVPGAAVVMLSGLGHTPIIEDPARTARHLLAFTANH